MKSPRKLEATLALFGLIFTALFWAGNVVVARGISETIPPVTLSFWRWLIALLVILPLTGLRTWDKRRAIASQWPLILLLAALSVGTFNILLYMAAHSTYATNIGLLNSTMPVMVALLSWLILAEKPGAMRIGGIFCALAGTLVIVGQGRLQSFTSLSVQNGDLYMLLAVVFWSLFSVLLKRHPVRLPPLEFLTVQIFFGVLVQLPFYLLEFAFKGGFSPGRGELSALLYVAIFPGLLAYGLWNFGVSRLGPQSAAMATYLVPLFVVLLAWWFLGEVPAHYHALGGALILGGVYLASRPQLSSGPQNRKL